LTDFPEASKTPGAAWKKSGGFFIGVWLRRKMANLKFNFDQYDELIANSCMSRMHAAASEIQTQAILKIKKSYKNRRPVYKKGPYAGQIYTARDNDIMAKTIRVVEKRGEHGLVGRNVLVIAGNFKTWWATQMEFGRGAWKGGASPFMRPALTASKANVKAILESGGGGTEV
jgi:hypothetical protein